jgi:hypothetical protein
MRSPPDVGVDIILDPYLLNVLPRSLVPTGVYLIIISILSYYLSGAIYAWLSNIGCGPSSTIANNTAKGKQKST